jgi:hypothetical protein
MTNTLLAMLKKVKKRRRRKKLRMFVRPSLREEGGKDQDKSLPHLSMLRIHSNLLGKHRT